MLIIIMHIPFKRSFNRKNDELRPITLVPNFYSHGDGSCLVKFGNTQVICAATIDEKVPPFLKHTKTGWITAEYGMLPCSSGERIDREAAKGKQSGRTVEIQRLIGRSLRSVVDLSALGERQISITGSYVAMVLACRKLLKQQIISINPVKAHAAAISCGLINNIPMLDLDYNEDSNAEVDSNFIMSDNNIIEIQACGEKHPFSEEVFSILLEYAKKARVELINKQDEALK